MQRSGVTTTVTIASVILALLIGSGVMYALAPSIVGTKTTTITTTMIGTSTITLGLPAVKPVPVTLNSSSTALLLFDFNICNPGYPGYSVYTATCNSAVRNATALLDNAKNSKIPILFTTVPGFPQARLTIPLPTNCTTCTVITSYAADKFYNTTLDTWLKTNHVKMVVLAGGSTNGAIMYTAYEANVRGLTAVVAADGTFRPNSQVQSLAIFQLLNEPGYANSQNQPLAVAAGGRHTVTISATNLITFK